MAQEIFKRYEKKYLLDPGQYACLRKKLTGVIEEDSYGKVTISNIYFDTEDFRLIRRSIEKPVYKEKLRLRAYGTVKDDSRVFAELKKKYDGVVYKRRTELSLKEAREYLYEGHYPDKDGQILREIDYVRSFYGLKPKMYVAYDRTAFFGKGNEELRITFDENIRCRTDKLDLIYGSRGEPLLNNGQVLMEIKIPGAMPVGMSRLLSQLGLYPVSYSKYGAGYKREFFLRSQEQREGKVQERSRITGGEHYAL